MTPFFCFLLVLSLGTLPTGDSRSVNVIADKPEDPYTSMVIENVNKNSTTALEHGDIRRSWRRNAAPCAAAGCKWPKSHRYVYVPVRISSSYSREQQNLIITALLTFHQSTCIRFIWRQYHHRDYLNFFSGSGCWSYVGRQGNEQDVSLQANGCLYLDVVQHEVLHALGFHHEQVRSDRDSYVRILTENILPGLENNFRIEQTNNLNTPYDFNSVMQYSNTAFSKNGQKTIVSKSNPDLIFGQAREMSQNDIDRVNRLYECGECPFCPQPQQCPYLQLPRR
uniref:Metalloendopeptidase n=1 Tax=Takifugu rubripes TaxID=31033 RepID=H2UKX4_TAKRU